MVLLSQSFLLHVTVLRLQMLAPALAIHLGRTLKVCSILAALQCVTAGLEFAGELVDRGMQLIVRGSAFCLRCLCGLVYLTFQSCAIVVFARIVINARNEARSGHDALATATATRAIATVTRLAASAGTTVFYLPLIQSTSLRADPSRHRGSLKFVPLYTLPSQGPALPGAHVPSGLPLVVVSRRRL